MKKCLSRWVSFFVIIIFFITLAGCNFGQKNILSPTTPEENKTTAPIPLSGEVTTTETPQPVSTGSNVSLVEPVSGSIMRWVDYSDFVYIPAGTFQMGEDSVLFTDFSPRHEVSLNGFWLQQAEVTNQQYAQCVDDGQCTEPAAEEGEPYRYRMSDYVNLPVVGVTWNQAEEYCSYINGRLPSEAEWEYAARGAESNPYPWGKDEPSCDLVNYDNCLDPSQPEDVRSYDTGASSFDVMDLSGNVYEWVNDWYQEDYYTGSPSVNPQGPEEGTERVYRGGSYSSPQNMVSPISRYSLNPDEHSKEIGFRCVLLKSGNSDSSVGYFAPACEVPSYEDIKVIAGPTLTPFPSCEPAKISSSCTWSGVQPITSIQISQANCYKENKLNSLSDNGWLLSCSESGTNPRIYNCDPAQNSSQGSNQLIRYCYSNPDWSQDIVCPEGYRYDNISIHTNICILIRDYVSMSTPPCGQYKVEKDGICIEQTTGTCRSGYMVINVDNKEYCYPASECYLPSAPESCFQHACPDGQTYDSDNFCCRRLNEPRYCPVGWAYDETQKICYYPDRNLCSGIEVSITLAYCPTLTPTATTPPKQCQSFGSQQSCEANGCSWEDYGGGFGFYHCVP